MTSAILLAIALLGPVAGAQGLQVKADGAAGPTGGDVHLEGNKLTYDLDHDTYCYAPSDDTLQCFTGAGLVYTIDSSGNIEYDSGITMSTSSAGNMSLAPDTTGYVEILNSELYVGDGTYSFGHTPLVGIEGVLEVDLVAYFDQSIVVESDIGLTSGGTISTTSGGNITLAPNTTGYVNAQNTEVYVGDGSYSWDHSPLVGSEGILEVDGAGYFDTTLDVAGNTTMGGNIQLTGGGNISTTSDGSIDLIPDGTGVVDITDAELYVGDGTYSWDHSPLVGVEGILEIDGACYLDSTLDVNGTVALGANNLTMTGDIADTTNRVAKGWFTDLEVTNAISGSVTGNAATATALQTARTIGGTSFDGTANIAIGALNSTNVGATTSAEMAGVISDETGSGLMCFATAPTFTTSIDVTGGGDIDADGADLDSGNTYAINDVDVLSSTTLGTTVVTSSLTTVGALDSGSVTSGFGDINNGTSSLTTGAITASGASEVDNTLTVDGVADVSQLTVQAHSTQANTSPLVLLEASDGTDLLTLHSDADSNVFLGIDAGASNTVSGSDGLKNIFIGTLAGTSNTLGKSNICVGSESCDAQTTGDFNTCIGVNTMTDAVNVSNCVAIGASALFDNLASGNTAIGTSAARLNTSGTNIVAIGSGAAYSGLVADNVVAIGTNALNNATATGGLAIGAFALEDMTNGLQNAAIGTESLRYLTGGSYNLALGYQAGLGSGTPFFSRNLFLGWRSGFSNESGNDNVYIGYQSGLANVSGSRAVGIGAGALAANTASNVIGIGYNSFTKSTGVNNLGLGAFTGSEITTGVNNVAIGTNAMQYADDASSSNVCIGSLAGQGLAGNAYSFNTFIGQSSGKSVQTGSNNLCLGYWAGTNITSGDDNLFLGKNTGDSATTGSGNLLIGNGIDVSTPGANNEINIGGVYKGDTSTALAEVADDLLVSGDMIYIEGQTASEVALKRSTTNLQVRLGDDSDYATLVSGYLEAVGTTPTAKIQDSAVGAAALSRTMSGLELTSGQMNPTSMYTPAVKFQSTDLQFSTENPKLLAAISGRATEFYAADTDGGMVLDFAVTADNPGTTNVPVVVMTVEPTGVTVTDVNAKGASTSIGLPYEDLTCTNDATLTTSGLVAANEFIKGVSTRITTALSGATGFDAGDGTVSTLYGTQAAATQGATTAVAIRGTNPSSGEVTLTFAGANCTAGVIRVTAHVDAIAAPTSN